MFLQKADVFQMIDDLCLDLAGWMELSKQEATEILLPFLACFVKYCPTFSSNNKCNAFSNAVKHVSE